MRLRRYLEHPNCATAVIGLSLLLMLPSVDDRLVLDDHVLSMLSASDGQPVPVEGLAHGRWGLFTFTTGEPALNHALMDEGALLPWWSDPRHLNAFLRPLSTLSHRVDFSALGEQVWLMHVHSLLWFALLLLGCRRLYAGLEADTHAPALGATGPGGAPLATLALCLFALDDAHGATVSWLANRNALIAATVGLPAILLHHRYRSAGERRGLWLGPLFFLGGLLGGEAAVGLLGYLAAYALCLDRGSWRARVLPLVPYGLVLIGWQLVYRQLGLGSAGSGAYHDPGREPLAFALALAQNLPILLSAQLGVTLADAAFWGYAPLIAALWAVAIASLALIGWVGASALRDRRARFWAVGMLLSAVPVSASLPGERLLLLVGIGGSGLLAHLLWPLLRGEARGARRLVLGGLAAVHLLLAPLSLPARAYSMPLLGRVLDAAEQSLPAAPPPGEQWFIINAPFDVMASYVQVARASRGEPRPARLRWLATASSALRLRRVGPASLEIRPARGFISSPPEKHYRRDVAALAPGSRVLLTGLTIEVLDATPDQRPAAARFTFDRPLEAGGIRFFYFEDGRYHAWQPPAAGEGAEFPAQDFFAVVLGGLLDGLR